MERKTISTRWLKFIGIPMANTKLMDYARKLPYADREELAIRMVRGDRFVIFHIDGERVSLASEQPEMVAA